MEWGGLREGSCCMTVVMLMSSPIGKQAVRDSETSCALPAAIESDCCLGEEKNVNLGHIATEVR